MGRMQRGWQLSKESWAVVKGDRSLLVFPVIAGLGTLILVAAFGGAALGVLPSSTPVAIVLGVIGLYLVMVVTVFCSVALTACAARSLEGVDTKASEGWAAARGHFGPILSWAGVQLVVGAAISALQAVLREGAGQLVSSLVGGLANFAWTIATFFVIPLIALEGLGPFDALKRSVAIIRQRWGEGVVGSFAIGGLVFLFAFLPGAALVALGIAIAGPAGAVARGRRRRHLPRRRRRADRADGGVQGRAVPLRDRGPGRRSVRAAAARAGVPAARPQGARGEHLAQRRQQPVRARAARRLTASSRARGGAPGPGRVSTRPARASTPHAGHVADGIQPGAARGVGEEPDRAAVDEVPLAPLHQLVDDRPQLEAARGQQVARRGPGAYGRRSTRPWSTSVASRALSTARGMSRWAWSSPKRRTPKNRSRRISSVQRSPTTSSARASAQVWRVVVARGAASRAGP